MIRTQAAAFRPASQAPRRFSIAAPESADRCTIGGTKEPPLDVQEHNAAQIDLMRRMGTGREPSAMIGWIGTYAARFAELMESDRADAWRRMLRDPEQRADALAAMEHALSQHAQA